MTTEMHVVYLPWTRIGDYQSTSYDVCKCSKQVLNQHLLTLTKQNDPRLSCEITDDKVNMAAITHRTDNPIVVLACLESMLTCTVCHM